MFRYIKKIKKVATNCSLIALVCGVMHTQAEVEAADLIKNDSMNLSLFGQIWLKANKISHSPTSATGQEGLTFDYEESRFGVKGSYQINPNLKSFYVLELGYNDADTSAAAFGQREALVGLEGILGEVAFGRMSSTYKMAGVKIDPFNDTAAGLGKGGPNYGLSDYGGDFFSDTIAYKSPELFYSGLKLNTQLMVDDSNADDHDFNFGLSYETDKLDVWLQYLDINNTVESKTGAVEEALRISAQLKLGQWTFAASNESYSKAKVDYLYFTTSYTKGKCKISASYGDVENDGSGFSLGYFHDLADNFLTYVLHSNVERDQSVSPDRQTSSVGLVLSF